MAAGTLASRYRITNQRGETIELDGTEEELRGKFLEQNKDPNNYKFELIGDNAAPTPPPQNQVAQPPAQEESWLSQILPSKETVIDFAAPLSKATWENTDIPDEDLTPVEKAAKYIARGGAVVGDAGMTALPVGKVAAGLQRVPKIGVAVGKGLEKFGEKAGNFVTKITSISPEALAKAGKYARNAAESGAEAAAYDSSVKVAEGADSYAPDAGALIGASALGGVLGGRADIKAGQRAKAAEQEFLKLDGRLKGVASKSAQNVNFAERNTGLKGDKAVHKIIEDNIKHGETVPQAIERINSNLDEVNNMFSGFMKDYGHLQIDKPISELRTDLMYSVRDNVGIGGEQNKKIALLFRNMLDDDITELAEKKLKERGKNYEQIDKYLRPSGNVNMDRVKTVMGNRLTLSELDQIKRRMWEKTGLFRRNAMSMKNAGEKNMAAHRGGYAVMDELTNLNDKEMEILEKIGGVAEDNLNDLGNKYIVGLQEQGILSGKLSNIYMRMNKERSKFIGTLRILNGAHDALEKHGLEYTPIYPKSVWEKMNAYDRTLLLGNSAATQQVGGHGGKALGNSLGLTPPRQ